MSKHRNSPPPEPRLMTVAEIVDATSIHPKGLMQITIPEFQRGLVWKRSEHSELIDSIDRGFPIGSLLLYEDAAASDSSVTEKTYFKLIDGLQRTQALKSYVRKVNTLFTERDLDRASENLIVEQLSGYSGANRPKIRRAVVAWVKGRPGFDDSHDWNSQHLIRTLVEKVLDLAPETAPFNAVFGELALNDAFVGRLDSFLEATKRKRDITGNKIPVVIYRGDSDNLKEIYELVNSKGRRLTPYDILAAQWLNCRLRIKNPKIRDAIYQKYIEMQNAGYPLDIRDQMKTADLRRERDYNLYQYLFGLGQFLSEEYPYLFSKTDADKVNRVSFNLVPACFEIPIEERARLQDEFENKADSIKNGKHVARLEQCILESISFVDQVLRDILSIGRREKSGRPPIHHTEQQITAMIATAFRAKYVKDTLAEKDGWENKRKTLVENLPMFYLHDILSNTWGRGGDQTLFRRVGQEYYLNSRPTTHDWDSVFRTWFNLQMETKKAVRGRVPLNSEQVLLLKYVHYGKFGAQCNDKIYDIEHIIAVSTLVRDEEIYWYLDDETHHKGPINTIGNLGLLDESTNRAKGKQSFYDFVHSQNPSSGVGDDQLEGNMTNLENLLCCPRDFLPSVLSEDTFLEFLLDRWGHLKSEFFEYWHDHVPDD